ncbi:MAG: tRNA (adenosine(37)-N6)-threonylcarbamoyltransferase complex dimerization subunit type 1 TsaB [Candidatus Omnitrophica bacterium]|nr:tRNA (adenosine(37)-N6)-threonylcarbamoyltransferase complex dimerization subunit type 1 TsaB [Candidatus Omnitrophota bacterium]
MKILGIDTSSRILSIALSQDDDIIAEENHILDRRHSSFLIPKIQGLLERAGVSIKAVDGFIIGLGPGSFTGLRIGVSAVKGFGIATQKPCIGVPSIDAMAFNAEADTESIVPVIDAKRGRVYSAVYKKRQSHIIKKTDHLLLPIDKLMKKVKGPAIFLGDGLELYRPDIEKLNKGSVFLEEEYWYPRAGNLIKLGIKKIRKGKKSDLSKLKPIYLYPKDCQVRK